MFELSIDNQYYYLVLDLRESTKYVIKESKPLTPFQSITLIFRENIVAIALITTWFVISSFNAFTQSWPFSNLGKISVRQKLQEILVLRCPILHKHNNLASNKIKYCISPMKHQALNKHQVSKVESLINHCSI